jgi:hypothetical protein
MLFVRKEGLMDSVSPSRVSVSSPKAGIAILILGISITLSGCSTLSASPGENPLDQSTEGLKTNQYGNWQEVTIDDAIPAYTPLTNYIPFGSEEAQMGRTVTHEEIIEGHAWAYNFAISEGIDSIAFDSSSDWDKWVREEAPKYIHPDYLEEITKPTTRESGLSEIVLSSPLKSLDGVLIYDGKRPNSIKIDNDIYIGFNESNPNSFTVAGALTSTYLVDDDRMMKQHAYVLYIVGHTERIEDVIDTPWYEKGGTSKVTVVFNFKYTIEKTSDGWKILGFDNSWYGNAE